MSNQLNALSSHAQAVKRVGLKKLWLPNGGTVGLYRESERLITQLEETAKSHAFYSDRVNETVFYQQKADEQKKIYYEVYNAWLQF